jgi:hypothetical protein
MSTRMKNFLHVGHFFPYIFVVQNLLVHAVEHRTLILQTAKSIERLHLYFRGNFAAIDH